MCSLLRALMVIAVAAPCPLLPTSQLPTAKILLLPAVHRLLHASCPVVSDHENGDFSNASACANQRVGMSDSSMRVSSHLMTEYSIHCSTGQFLGQLQ